MQDTSARSRDELEGRVEELERTVELLETTVDDLQEILLGEYGLSVAAMEAESKGSIVERLEDVEIDDIDTQSLLEASETASLPIQQLTAARKAGHITDESDKNKFRATLVWSEFYERCVRDPGQLKLTSQQVQNILQSEDLPSHRQTVGRVMKWVAKLSNPDPSESDPSAAGNVVQLKKRAGKKVLVADRDDFESLIDAAQASVRTEVDEELDQLEQAEAQADD